MKCPEPPRRIAGPGRTRLALPERLKLDPFLAYLMLSRWRISLPRLASCSLPGELQHHLLAMWTSSSHPNASVWPGLASLAWCLPYFEPHTSQPSSARWRRCVKGNKGLKTKMLQIRDSFSSCPHPLLSPFLPPLTVILHLLLHIWPSTVSPCPLRTPFDLFLSQLTLQQTYMSPINF